jgi:hypothetical protein
MVDERKPQGPMDWMTVIDMTIKCWEELRLHRASAALIRGAMLNALIYFLKVIKPPKRPELIEANKILALKNTKDPKRLASLDRYDRYALTELRRASKDLRSERCEDSFCQNEPNFQNQRNSV